VRRWLAAAAVLGGAGLLASCATLSEEACRQGDWRGIGYVDGTEGRLETHVQRHAEACSGLGITPDVARWREGRAEGLRLYCRPERAYRIGREGRTFNPVCEGHDLGALATAYERGRRYYDLGMEIDRLETEVDALNDRIDELLDQDDIDRATRRLIAAYRDDIARSERTMRLLAAEQAAYARFP
jgi:hypothetical protein